MRSSGIDADQVLQSLQKAGYAVESQRVHDPHAMQTALHSHEWDAIVSAYRLIHRHRDGFVDRLKRHPNSAHLAKPFSPQVLALKVREPLVRHARWRSRERERSQ